MNLLLSIKDISHSVDNSKTSIGIMIKNKFYYIQLFSVHIQTALHIFTSSYLYEENGLQ